MYFLVIVDKFFGLEELFLGAEREVGDGCEDLVDELVVELEEMKEGVEVGVEAS